MGNEMFIRAPLALKPYGRRCTVLYAVPLGAVHCISRSDRRALVPCFSAAVHGNCSTRFILDGVGRQDLPCCRQSMRTTWVRQRLEVVVGALSMPPGLFWALSALAYERP